MKEEALKVAAYLMVGTGVMLIAGGGYIAAGLGFAFLYGGIEWRLNQYSQQGE